MEIFIIIVAVILLLVGWLLFQTAPRMLGRVKREPFLGVFYAHRGLFDNASEAPENSLAAFRKAVEAGYGMELDVQLSKDNRLVVFHDATLKRMCGVEGNVWDYTLEELKQFKLLDSDERIPTLEEFLEVVDGKAPFILEYKLDRPQTLVCELADRLLQEYPGVYCIESFHPQALIWYRKHRPEVMRGQLCEEFFRNPAHRGKIHYWLISFLPFNFMTRPDFIAYNHAHAGNPARRLCKRMGGLSVAYTVRSLEEYEKAKTKFDLIIFDSCILK